MSNKCETCKHWCGVGDWRRNCVRHAPVSTLLITTDRNDDGNLKPVWPVTTRDMWCGDWELTTPQAADSGGE